MCGEVLSGNPDSPAPRSAHDPASTLTGVLMVASIGFRIWGFVQAASIDTPSTAGNNSGSRSLAPATASDRQTCARQASGGMYSADEIRASANAMPDIAVAYSGCIMRMRRARAGN